MFETCNEAPSMRLAHLLMVALFAGLVACSGEAGGDADLFDPADAGAGETDAGSEADAPPDTTGDGDAAGPEGGDAGPDPDAASDAGGGDTAEPDAGPEPPRDPGRLTIQRLNRSEYDNTVRDLLGTALRPGQNFPDDDHGFGYDHIGDVLSLSPLHAEMYLLAAESLVAEALEIPTLEPVRAQIEAESADATVGAATSGGTAWNLWSNGTLTAMVDVPEDGQYRLEMYGFAQQAGPDLAQMSFVVDALPVATLAVEATRAAPGLIGAEVELDAGRHLVGVSFNNDYYDPDAGEDRNLVVDWFAVEGPLDLVAEPNPTRDWLLVCEPDADAPRGEVEACAEEILRHFTWRAWRRPVTDAEIDDLMALVRGFLDAGFVEGELYRGGDFDMAIEFALIAVLVSPHFIFRVEYDEDPTSLEPHPLSDWELASRLSYFLWSSMPDETLFDLARDGRLHEPDVLAEQVDRMLDDPRSIALVDNFAGQWLWIRALDAAAPDAWYYPDFDEDLRDAMRTEMRLFFESFLLEDRSMLELITGDDSYIDARLAAHYGVDDFTGDGFVPYTFTDGRRGGLLGQAGLLTALSYPTRTSPVRRGKFVLGQLLCREPPPPPPGVEGLPETEEVEGLSLRERLEIHMTNPTCASCHSEMDPIGFGLETFDGIGQWRDAYPSGPVDATGELPNGATFDGPRELAEVIASDAAVARCMARQLYVYALGRGPMTADSRPLVEIANGFADGGYRFRDLATLIVQSEPFRMRRGEPEPTSDTEGE